MPHQSGSATCRLCNSAYERITHLVACPILFATFTRFIELVNAYYPRIRRSPALLLLGCVRSEVGGGSTSTLAPGLFALLVILWKFIILNFTLIDTEDAKFSDSFIWTRTVRRFRERCEAAAFGHRIALARAVGSDREPPNTTKLNLALLPLAYVTQEGAVEFSPALATLETELGVAPPQQVNATPVCAPCRPIKFVPAGAQP